MLRSTVYVGSPEPFLLEDIFDLLNAEKVRQRLALLSEATGLVVRLSNGTGPEPGARAVCRAVRVGGIESRRRVEVLHDPGREETARALCDLVVSDLASLAAAEHDLASLSQEVADRYEELNFLYDVSASVGSVDDVDQVCGYIVRQTARVLDAGRCSLMLLDDTGSALQVVAQVGLPDGVPEATRVALGHGISGRVAATGRPVIVSGLDEMPADALGSAVLEHVDHLLCYPLTVPSDGPGSAPLVLGVLNVTRKLRGRAFTSSDLKLVAAIAGYAAVHIRNCRLLKAQREKMALEQEMALAARIQTGLFPVSRVAAGDLEIASAHRLAQNVGGDYFDYWEPRPGRLALVVADVSGHNVAAALLAGSLRSTLRGQAVQGLGVARTVASINELMFDDLCRLDMFLSLFYMEYDPATGSMVYCRAGHPKPLHILRSSERWLDTEGPLIGIHRRAEFEEKADRLSPGETLVLYTDGLTEAGAGTDEPFDEEALRRASRAMASQPAEDLAEGLISAARAHLAAGVQVDDMAVVVMKRH